MTLFALECIATDANCQYFWLKLFCYLVAIPGSFIFMAPYHQVVGSKTMKQLLLIFICIMPVALVNTFLILGPMFTKLPLYLLNKLKKTFPFLLLILVISWLFGSLLA